MLVTDKGAESDIAEWAPPQLCLSTRRGEIINPNMKLVSTKLVAPREFC